MAAACVWRHPERREVLLTLYVQLRMVHVRGWLHLLVAQEPRGSTWLAVTLAPSCSEEDARDWSRVLPVRYRVETTAEALLSEPRRFSELYMDAGVQAFLREHERELERAVETRRRWRKGEG